MKKIKLIIILCSLLSLNMRYGASGSGNDTWKNKNLKLDFIVY